MASWAMALAVRPALSPCKSPCHSYAARQASSGPCPLELPLDAPSEIALSFLEAHGPGPRAYASLEDLCGRYLDGGSCPFSPWASGDPSAGRARRAPTRRLPAGSAEAPQQAAAAAP